MNGAKSQDQKRDNRLVCMPEVLPGESDCSCGADRSLGDSHLLRGLLILIR